MKLLLNIFTQLSRVFIGGLFIFSGFVKLVDPLGSAYKFDEYFSAEVLNLEFLIPYSLPFSILLITAELVLGITLLIGFKPKATTWSLFGLTLVFLFLTWYSAYYDKVTDCGCFGDAIKLSTWATFYKNVIFIILIAFLLSQLKNIKPVFGKTGNQWITFASVLGCLYVAMHVLNHLPLIDFRAYAEGKNIRKGMEYKDDGEIPPVHDFFLESETEDLTETILDAEKALLFVSYEIEKSDETGFKELEQLHLKAKENGYLVYGLSASSTSEINRIKKENNLSFEFLFCDATTLKTMIRSNPGILILNRATVQQKLSYNDINKVSL